MKRSIIYSYKSILYWSLAIFLSALVLRIIFIIQSQDIPLFTIPIMDMAYHHQWAISILENKDYIQGPFFRAPLYPYLVAFLFLIFGSKLLVVSIIQSIIGSLSCVILFLIGRRVFNRITGITAGFLMAGYGTLIFYEGLLLIPTLVIFLNLLSMLMLMRGIDLNKKGYIIFSGFFLGLSVIARPTILLFALVIFIWMTMKTVTNKRIRLSRKGLLFGLFVLLPILPITIYNMSKSGEFTLIGTYGGLNFYIGNNLQSDGVSAKIPNARRDWWGMMEDATRIAENESGKPLTEAEQSSFWFKKTIGEISSEPLFFVKHLIKKTVLLVEGNELSNNFDFYFFAHRIPILKYLIGNKVIYYPYGIIFPLAIFGLFLGYKKSLKTEICAMFIISYFFAIILFFVTARYRLPLVPMMILFASYTLTHLKHIIAESSKIKISVGIILFLSCLFLSNSDLYGYVKNNDAQGYYTMATLQEKQGNTELEESYYQRAIREDTTLSEAYNNLGLLMAKQGKIDSAIYLIEKASRFDKYNFMLKYNLGYLYLELDRPENAITPLEETIEIVPNFLYAINNLGLANLKLKNYNKAQEIFHRAITIDTSFISAYYNLAVCYQQTGQLDSAVIYYQHTLELNPTEAGAYYNLGMLWLELNRIDSALVNFEKYQNFKDIDSIRQKQVRAIIDSLR